MDRKLVELLVDPVTMPQLRYHSESDDAWGRILNGFLSDGTAATYPVVNGIPRFRVESDTAQAQTEKSFGFKWNQRHSYGQPGAEVEDQEWLVTRYGFDNVTDMRSFFASRRRILDAGCGAGHSASLWLDDSWGGRQWIGVDISSAIDVAQERLGHVPNTHFVQADMMLLPFRDSTFDTIFSEGVLHHTPSTERALKGLVRLLEPGGEFLFYVYRKKSPVREFVDDYVRNAVSDLPPEQAWEELRPLTRLGEALAGLHAEIEVPESIAVLGIPAGRYDVQRLLYWHFAKLFWSDAKSFDENHHINFDWYHPKYAHRQTETEVRRWCGEAGLVITAFNAQESGFTVRATKG